MLLTTRAVPVNPTQVMRIWESQYDGVISPLWLLLPEKQVIRIETTTKDSEFEVFLACRLCHFHNAFSVMCYSPDVCAP